MTVMHSMPITFDFVVWLHCFEAGRLRWHPSPQPWVVAQWVNDLPFETVRLISEQLHTAPDSARHHMATYDIVRSILDGLHPMANGPEDVPWLSGLPSQYVRVSVAAAVRVASIDDLIWEFLFEAAVIRNGVAPWVAADRLASIDRPFADVLTHVFLDNSSERPGRMAAVAIVEEWTRRLRPDLLVPSEEEWANFRHGSTN